MKDDLPTQELVVCGYAAAVRLDRILPRLGGPIRAVTAHTKRKLLAELERRQPPLAVVEHYVNRVDEKSELASWGVPSHAAENISFARDYIALELLPEMTARSPEAKFVITSHSRVGIPRAERNAYRECPSVLKVVNFLNEKTTTEWLLKKLSRIYLGTIWKPDVPS